MPLGPQLASLLANEETRKSLLYRSQCTPGNDGEMSDIFHGEVYQRMKNDLFREPADIAMALYVDGFTPFKRASVTLTIVHMICLNLPPEER